jgi:WD40 repeat protein
VHKFHEKTINKIDFNPNEARQLITGCQDGSMKLIDTRVDWTSVLLTFKHDAEDKVTDLQFNPSPSMSNQFVSGAESGNVSIWDTRNPDRYVKKYPAHLSLVHLDWHPEERHWLATASIDKQICVSYMRVNSRPLSLCYKIHHHHHHHHS